MYSIVILIFVIVTLLIITGRILFYKVQVEGASMEPTIQNGDVLLVSRFRHPKLLKKHTIVVVKLPPSLRVSSSSISYDPKLIVKRIVGLPGDIISFNHSDNLSNNALAFMDKVKQTELKLSGEQIFIVGDSPGRDSRTYGPVPIKCCVGIVIGRLKN